MEQYLPTAPEDIKNQLPSDYNPIILSSLKTVAITQAQEVKFPKSAKLTSHRL